MHVRLRAFLATLRNHPFRVLLTLLWPWAFWWLDKAYGEIVYAWLTKDAPRGGPFAFIALVIARNLFLISASLFLVWIAALFYLMWKESRPAPDDHSVVDHPQRATSRRRDDPIMWPDEPSISSSLSDLSSYNAEAIVISGKNAGQREVHLHDAHLVSGITGAQVPLEVSVRSQTVNGGWHDELVPIASINPIPPGAPIELVLSLGRGNLRGISEREFMGRWGRMSFVACYDGIEYRRVYDEQTVARVLQRMRYGPLPPRVTKKGQDNPDEY